MINIINAKKFCSEDISLIENYDKAINDDIQTWHCHHRKETDEGLSLKQLKEVGLYLNRPANELIFLTKAEHSSLHKSGKNHPFYGKHFTEEHRNKISKGNKGKKRTEEQLERYREVNLGDKNPFYGKHHSEEIKKIISEARLGKKWINNGIRNKICEPEKIEYYTELGWKVGKLPCKNKLKK